MRKAAAVTDGDSEDFHGNRLDKSTVNRIR